MIILCVLVLVHEFGHFAVAKMNGIYVEEFSIGMGPKVFSWGKGETVYSIRAFPIGGFVKMVGEDEASDNERAFCNKSILSRMAVTFAGPAMNFVFAIIFFMIAFMYFGSPASNGLIGQVYPDYPAAVAGLRAGDVLVTLDDTLWQMISGQMAVEVAGPVGMVSMVGEYADVGLMYLFLFAGVLSVNLGVMNLLPIPALDGSRLVFLLVEAIRRKPIDRDKEAMVNFVGFVLLMTLMLVVTFCDIERLIK